MKTTKLISTLIGLVLFLALFTNTAFGRVGFYMGVGVGHGPSFHSSRHYRPHHFYNPRYYHHYRPWHRPGFSLRIGGCCPIIVSPPVVVDTPIVVEVPSVVTERRVVVEEPVYYEDTGNDDDTARLFEELRQRKSELLKKLRIGDKEKSIEAIRELAGFSFDDEVRNSLEEVLLTNPDVELRIEVAKAFGRTTNQKVLAALQQAKVYDSSMEVRLEAHNAILKIKGYR